MGFRTGNIIFNDDFTSSSILNSGPDRAWNTTFPGGGRVLPQLGEDQIFLDDGKTVLGSTTVNIDPFTIGNGVLNIQAKPTPSTLLSSVGGWQYTSGMVNTGGGAFDFKYGYVEIRAQVPTGQGLLPTFYMVRSDRAQLGEIDIFELPGSKSSYLNQTVHYSTSGTGLTDVGKVVRTALPVDLSKGFHTYGVDWQEQRITFYLDGVAMGSMATPDSLKAPMFMIAHIGVGGTWGGQPDGSTPWPATMKVDYVRVWQDAAASIAVTKSGTAGSESMAGGDGNDVLRGFDGNDVILGSRGNDLVDGGNGADRLLGGMGADTLVGGTGADTLEGGRGNDTYVMNDTGNVIIDLPGSGFDTVETNLLSMGVGGTIEGLVFKGAGNFKGFGTGVDNRIVGGAGLDTLIGGAGSDTLIGNAGSDKLNGGLGNDVMYSGGGNDTLLGDGGSDLFVINGRDGAGSTLVADFQRGIDKINVSALGFTSFTDVTSHSAMNGQGNLYLAKNGETVVMQAIKLGQLTAGDFVWGTSTSSVETAAMPTPVSSTTSTSTSTSSTTGDSNANLLNGTAGADQISGAYGNDTLNGGAGNDWLNGGAGADRLNAGTGNDTMIGGTGADTFVFTASSTASQAHISDFELGVDHLAVGGLGLTSFTSVLSHAINNAQGFAQISAGNETILLHGVTVAELHASDFIF